MEFAIGDRVKIKNRDIIGFVVEYTKDNTTGDRSILKKGGGVR